MVDQQNGDFDLQRRRVGTTGKEGNPGMDAPIVPPEGADFPEAEETKPVPVQATPAATSKVLQTRFEIPHAHAPEQYPDDPDPEMWIVTFDNVTKTFGQGRKKFTAVKDVSFRVYDIPDIGEFICLLGPSGCGKSTILNMIAGFYPPTTGTVLVRGKPISGPGSNRGMVFQNYSSFPQLMVWQNVAFGLMCQELRRRKNPLLAALDSLIGIRGHRRRLIKEEAMEWVDKVNLSGNENKYPHELSGGMRQRVAIARTLALKPDIILMDEPFGALDRVTRWEMQDLLVRIWDEVEATVFLITHDLAEAVYLGDRVYILSESPGTILEEAAVPQPSEPAAEMQRRPEFAEIVHEISTKVERRYFEEELSAKEA